MPAVIHSRKAEMRRIIPGAGLPVHPRGQARGLVREGGAKGNHGAVAGGVCGAQRPVGKAEKAEFIHKGMALRGAGILQRLERAVPCPKGIHLRQGAGPE